MANTEFDLAIIGAGPSGATLALCLAPTGIKIAIFDKEQFPREVICGDALSGQVNHILKRMPDGIYPAFLNEVKKTPSWGIRFYAPGNESLDLPYVLTHSGEQEPPGYICPRFAFDYFLFQRLQKYSNIRVFEREEVTNVIRSGHLLSITTEKRAISTEMAAGADGLNSIARSKLSNRKLDTGYYCMAIRTYFTGVTGFHPENFIELFFLKELLPAYFWVFPEVGGQANVGLGLPFQDVLKKKLSLKSVMEQLLREHPLIRPRFRYAVMTGKPKARGLAINRKLNELSGERYLLLGDAALLVDPFTGEGVGKAMASAESAAAVIRDCFEKGDFSSGATKQYDHRIIRRMGIEHSTSSTLQKFAKYPWLFDKVVRKANKNRTFKEFLASAFNDDNVRKQLASPLFYAKVFF